MRGKSGLLLVLGSVSLYSGMTCIYSPFVVGQVPLKSPVPSLVKSGQVKVLAFNNYSAQEPTLRDEEEKTSNIENNISSEVANEVRDDTSASTTKVNLVYRNYNTTKPPQFTRGIYLSNNMGNSSKRMAVFLKDSQKYNINTHVIDVQPRMIRASMIKKVLDAGIYPVARVVVFNHGLKTKYPQKYQIDRVMRTLEAAAKVGFKEVQLDYIRYADLPSLQRLPLKFKYQIIDGILKRANEKAKSLGIHVGADVFGRITLNTNDHIGQKLENFAKYMNTIYPMVYPSHYTGDRFRITHPYETVKEAIKKSEARIQKARIVAYIQGFTWKVELSGLSLSEYIRKQIKAVEDAGGDGFIIWNPRNIYGASYTAMIRHKRLKAQAKSKVIVTQNEE